ncbi:hypothetical protein C8R41DRAFT_925055 [Lentinula lateritia]|uniref:JmjC domain-containing protein n=1 Tax=Lentinula lateritia TaxID=40482 RepID=A0ABQ8V1L2_9AGAR|nr:hypothetical protein C8R41DRAFT_925055 [Lentinula lateritia]
MNGGNMNGMLPCVANEARLHFKINSVAYNSKFTSSHGDPHATSGLENCLGDVHLNLDTQRYWVKTESVWEVQSVGVSFVHPKSKGSRKYTWDQFANKWKHHAHNPGKISEHSEGSSGRKRSSYISNDDEGRTGRLSDKRRRMEANTLEEESVIYKGQVQHTDSLRTHLSLAGNQQGRTSASFSAPLKLTTSRYLARGSRILGKRALSTRRIRPSDSTILKVAPPFVAWDFHERYFYQDLMASGEADVNVANRGFAERVAVDQVLENFAGKKTLSGLDPYYSIIDFQSKATFGGFKEMDFDWADPSPLVITDPEFLPLTFTQNAYLTLPHVDGMGAHMRFGHIWGAKLWILWPLTAENYSMSIRSGPPEVVLMEAPVTFHLPPCTIHACLSLTQSAHVGQYFLCSDGFEDAKIINRTIMEAWKRVEMHWKNQMDSRNAFEKLDVQGSDDEASMRQRKIREVHENEWNIQSAESFWSGKR